jgi:hypothetical protein
MAAAWETNRASVTMAEALPATGKGRKTEPRQELRRDIVTDINSNE